jgi:hypothetical protein
MENTNTPGNGHVNMPQNAGYRIPETECCYNCSKNMFYYMISNNREYSRTPLYCSMTGDEVEPIAICNSYDRF